MENDQLVRCIVCDRDFPKSNKDEYSALTYFDDCCICRSCLEKERHGYPRPEHRSAVAAGEKPTSSQ